MLTILLNLTLLLFFFNDTATTEIYTLPLHDALPISIEYSLYPHQGTWKEAKTVRRGYEFNNPLIAVMGESHKGKLPASKSFFSLSPPNLILTTVKKAEDSEAWIVQWYDAGGEDTQAQLTLPQEPKKVFASNFMEADRSTVTHKGNTVAMPTKKNSVVTLKIYF